MMLRYPGGKNKASKSLHSLAPVVYSEYREPFLGGAGMLWEVPAGKRVWVNDANPIIIKYWKALRDDDGFIDRQVAFAKWAKTATDAEQRAAFDRARSGYDLEDDPFSFWILNRWAVGALVSTDRAEIASFSSLHVRDGMNHVHRHKLESMRNILRRPNVRLTTRDYLPLLETPGDGVWVFLDPPYPMTTKIYEWHWEWDDQQRLADHLRTCKHRWMLTNANNPRIRDMYNSYRIEERRYTGTMTHRHRSTSDEQTKTELVITNY